MLLALVLAWAGRFALKRSKLQSAIYGTYSTPRDHILPTTYSDGKIQTAVPPLHSSAPTFRQLFRPSAIVVVTVVLYSIEGRYCVDTTPHGKYISRYAFNLSIPAHLVPSFRFHHASSALTWWCLCSSLSPWTSISMRIPTLVNALYVHSIYVWIRWFPSWTYIFCNWIRIWKLDLLDWWK